MKIVNTVNEFNEVLVSLSKNSVTKKTENFLDALLAIDTFANGSSFEKAMYSGYAVSKNQNQLVLSHLFALPFGLARSKRLGIKGLAKEAVVYSAVGVVSLKVLDKAF